MVDEYYLDTNYIHMIYNGTNLVDHYNPSATLHHSFINILNKQRSEAH